MERYGEEVPEGEPHEEIGVSRVLYALPVRHQDGQVCDDDDEMMVMMRWW